ncbi:hypothetical protein [Streptomyces sp. WAC06614]|uniref:hypothetical protein n=1 Tax=Streptomyces sp. WAC06614 TaxID=2487416 RepID=UPI000F76ECD4|nr:hypothetical protein [Streptomyces sp. WAC06614]RSS81119.1 hypothetical protein EF918_11375 [Streptomyces sp. WAC06614]
MYSKIEQRGFRAQAIILAAVLLALVATSMQATGVSEGGGGPCPAGVAQPRLTSEYKSGVETALRSKEDIWGEKVLASRNGPTYDNVKGYLTPLMYVRQPVHLGPMTDTGVYYIPFGFPKELTGRGAVALHVADGSQIMSNHWNGRNLKVFVGHGDERYGACLANLKGPHLSRGYLPVLESEYKDAQGVSYRQQSFAAHIPGTDLAASFIRITASGGGKSNSATIKLREVCGRTACGLSARDNRLVRDGKTFLYFTPGAKFDGTDLTYDVKPAGHSTDAYLVRPVDAARVPRDLKAGPQSHSEARERTQSYWDRRLDGRAVVEVPEQRVNHATKALLIQNLLMAWRYSLGNSYEDFYQAESSDTVGTLGHLGFTEMYASSLADLLPLTKGRDRRNFEMGAKLLHAADYWHLTHDTPFLLKNEPTYSAFLEDLIKQNAADPNNLLERQRYSSDIARTVYGLHQIGLAQRGAQVISQVWLELGYEDRGQRYADFAAKLKEGYERAVRKSRVTLADGSLFTPVSLLDNEKPWDPITEQVLGGYWNLVSHYGFASDVYAPGGPEATETLQYVLQHGGRLLGLLRAHGSAHNNVYEVEQLKFLAANDQADQLVLSFYGKLAHGMTRDTFISGEAHNVGPILTKWPPCRGEDTCIAPSPEKGWTKDEYYRAMYLPPNSANNTSLLEALRLMLAHTPADSHGRHESLELAYFTPRGWMEQGNHITVRGLPTPFGPLTYSLTSDIDSGQVQGFVDVPDRNPAQSVSLRIRVPEGHRLSAVSVNGVPWQRFSSEEETVDLSGLSGHVSVVATYGAGSPKPRGGCAGCGRKTESTS